MAGALEIFARHGFLSAGSAADIRAGLASAEGMLAAIQPEPGARLAVHEEVRRAWEVDLPDSVHDDVVARIEAERAVLEAFFGVCLEPNDAIAALRYTPGAFYRTHRDAAGHPHPDGLHRRAVSIVVFLNSAAPAARAAFTGGTLRLYETDHIGAPPVDIVPVEGTLVAFRSSVLHEVLPVETGTRLSLVTWLLRARGAPDERRSRSAPT